MNFDFGFPMSEGSVTRVCGIWNAQIGVIFGCEDVVLVGCQRAQSGAQAAVFELVEVVAFPQESTVVLLDGREPGEELRLGDLGEVCH